jgi:hypothetical protein
MTATKTWAMCALALAVTACDSSSNDDNGEINLALTDATVDHVTEVHVQFTGVTLKPANGEPQEFLFDTPKDFDLMQLQDGVTAELLPDTTVPAGEYNWIRLHVNAEFDNVYDSYARLDDGTEVEIRVPSGGQSGLQLSSGFTVLAGQTTDLVLDWDLRKALTEPQGQPGIFVRPSLRIVDMATYGTLDGIVDPLLAEDESCTNDLLADTGNAVYVYTGDVPAPADIQGMDTDPLVTASVNWNGMDYAYRIPYMPVGEYTVAFTCQASDDVADGIDEIAFPVVTTGVVIEDGGTTTVDFHPPDPI